MRLIRRLPKEDGLEWQFKIAFLITLLVVVASALLLAYDLGWLRGREDLQALSAVSLPPGVFTNSDLLYMLNRYHVSITAGLAITCFGFGFGLWTRRRIALLICLLGSAWVGLTYTSWYRTTVAFVRNTEATEYAKQHDPFLRDVGMLLGGSGWDLAVLAIDLLLLVWLLVAILKASRTRSELPKNDFG